MTKPENPQGAGKIPENERDEFIRYQSVVIDPNTHLPIFPHQFENIRSLFEGANDIGVMFLHLPTFLRLEATTGWEVYDQILSDVAKLLQEFCDNHLTGAPVLAQKSAHDDNFVMFLSEQSIRSAAGSMEELAQAMVGFLQTRLSNLKDSRGWKELRIMTGYSVITQDPMRRFERSIHKAVSEAEVMAFHAGENDKLRKGMELRRILSHREIRANYQPILDLKTGRIFAFEALARGPVGSPFEYPDELFAVGADAKLTGELDSLCRQAAVTGTQGLLSERKLFVNTLTDTLATHEFEHGQFARAIDEAGIRPEQVVIELTERQGIQDFGRFSRILDHLQDLGYSIALDDIGTGYSSLKAISEIRPQYLKIDMSLVRNVHRSLIKQELLATLVDIGQKVDATIIAEGIETEDEFGFIRGTGIPMGQGWLFGKAQAGISDSITFPA